MHRGYEGAKGFSEGKLQELRDQLKRLDLGDRVVVACGSFARREASEYSDIDYYTLSEDDDPPNDVAVTSAIKTVIAQSPAADGAFGTRLSPSEMLANIGGQRDDNAKITQRVLFLLEGEWLYNRDRLFLFRRQMLEKYVRDTMADHQLTLFLLNDVIRYYRTMAVDYEFKTTEGDKPWAIRNIKLVFSRKLLYASGLFSIAMTADRTREDKIRILEELFGVPVIERMRRICGNVALARVMKSYDVFLDRLSDRSVRSHLEALGPNERTDVGFREIKNEGYQFTRELLALFENTFDRTHPIRRAVVF